MSETGPILTMPSGICWQSTPTIRWERVNLGNGRYTDKVLMQCWVGSDGSVLHEEWRPVELFEHTAELLEG